MTDHKFAGAVTDIGLDPEAFRQCAAQRRQAILLGRLPP